MSEKIFHTGPAHVFNPTPTSAEEALAHGNALAASGNYPVGTSGCFNVGISGGCGIDCYLFKDGDCDVDDPVAFIPEILECDDEQIASIKKTYPLIEEFQKL